MSCECVYIRTSQMGVAVGRLISGFVTKAVLLHVIMSLEWRTDMEMEATLIAAEHVFTASFSAGVAE